MSGAALAQDEQNWSHTSRLGCVWIRGQTVRRKRDFGMPVKALPFPSLALGKSADKATERITALFVPITKSFLAKGGVGEHTHSIGG